MIHNSETHVIAEIVCDCREHNRHRQNSGIDEEKKQRILGRTNTSRDNANYIEKTVYSVSKVI